MRLLAIAATILFSPFGLSAQEPVIPMRHFEVLQVEKGLVNVTTIKDYHPHSVNWLGWPAEVIPPEWPFTATDCRKLLPEMYALQKEKITPGEPSQDAVLALLRFSQGCDVLLMTEPDGENTPKPRKSLPFSDCFYLKLSGQLQASLAVQFVIVAGVEKENQRAEAREKQWEDAVIKGIAAENKRTEAREREWRAAFDQAITLVLAGGLSAPVVQRKTFAETVKQMSAAITDTMRANELQRTLEDIARAGRDQAEILRQLEWQQRQREALKLIKP